MTPHSNEKIIELMKHWRVLSLFYRKLSKEQKKINWEQVYTKVKNNN